MDNATIVCYEKENRQEEDCSWEISPSNVKKLQVSDFYTQKLLLQQMSVLKKRIPKQIMSLEEKYIRHCLELIHMSAMRANSLPVPSKINFFPDNLVVNSSMDPIVGPIRGSTSMVNLLNSPLLCQSDTSDHEDQRFRSTEPVHKRLVSFSSTNSTVSDPPSSSSYSSSSSSSTYSQGMLHCSWNNGFPRYVFSVEDEREVYTTNLSKVDCLKDKGFDYIYTFLDQDSDLVGKMRVSTSFTLGTDIMETQFILCATCHHHSEGGMHNTSNQTVKKGKGLSKKVASIFKGSRNYRQRTFSKFDGSSELQEISEGNEFSSNLELAAIVVKDEKKVEGGGWGLKFLKEQRNTRSVEHSRSMNVIIPAGFHGGPETENGGASSLVERWRNDGSCDCGGWDIGCPLTLLNAGPNPNNKEGVFGKSNSFELFTQGGKEGVAVMEVRNVHDGLYYIHYQSSLSALQSLSIAVAIIHSHSPALKPKVYRN